MPLPLPGRLLARILERIRGVPGLVHRAPSPFDDVLQLLGVALQRIDAEELKDIVEGRGSAMDKAKKAADALKDPGQKPAGKQKRQPPA